jgi:subfamily B ATP-binding cassette protein HlyB/CyaB
MDEPSQLRKASETFTTSAAAAGQSTADSGLWALVGVAAHFNVSVDVLSTAQQLAAAGRRANRTDLMRLAAAAGLEVEVLRLQDILKLRSVPRPAIVLLRDGQYAILGQQSFQEDDLLYCGATHPTPRPLEYLARECSGEVIIVSRNADSPPPTTATDFGVRWFMPSILRHRNTYAHVLIASVFLQLCTLISPLLFQVIIDKVLVHFSTATLVVCCVGLIISATLEVTLTYLRSQAMLQTGNNLDLELGGRVFTYLLKLPLAYFEGRATGQIIARLRELDTVRRFLTGQTLTTVIDVFFALLFTAALLAYSAQLTLIVLISIVLYVAIVTLARPVIKARSKEVFVRNADVQQFIVESVSGICTLKAAAIEAALRMQWLEKFRSYMQLSLKNDMLGIVAGSWMQYISKLSTAALLFFGSRLVMGGEMTIGQLIAVNMLAQQIAGPISRISSFWQDFQQIQVSIARLGDIMAASPEVTPVDLTNLPPIRGELRLHNVTFRYRDEGPDVIRNLSLHIPQGEMIGIVGPSGSGKSTLTKLVQRLYLPQQGQVTIDGVDILRMHPGWLRQQLGVVLQENLLFNRTIHDNIALAAPYLTREQVITIAQQAGADEFIRRLPQGYDTRVEERGTNLSGGQRQRIAIARALARNPRILILDEATSAVDYESERIVQAKLTEFARDRTVIIIAHRLAAVRRCHRIISMVDGRIVEDGTHDELLRTEGGTYRGLWKLQIAE